jgi:hypothetical protein
MPPTGFACDLPGGCRHRCGRYGVAVAERSQLAALSNDCRRFDLRIGHPAAHQVLHRTRSGSGLRYICRHQNFEASGGFLKWLFWGCLLLSLPGISTWLGNEGVPGASQLSIAGATGAPYTAGVERVTNDFANNFLVGHVVPVGRGYHIDPYNGDGGWVAGGGSEGGYALAREFLTVPKPESMSFLHGAALPMCFLSAFAGLYARVQAGDTVYIPGGGELSTAPSRPLMPGYSRSSRVVARWAKWR